MVKRKKEKLIKVIDEVIKLPNKDGNGLLKFTASTNNTGQIYKYSLAYINFNIFRKDNGRVLGYDNTHGYHHRHYMGEVEDVNFTTYEAIANRFESEWRVIHEKAKK